MTKRQIDRLPRPISAAAGRKFLSGSVSIGDAEIKALRRLDPPETLVSLTRQVIAVIAQEVDLLSRAATEAKHGMNPIVAFDRISPEGNRLNEAEDAIWKRLGVSVCRS